jgi:hypothetical protein
MTHEKNGDVYTKEEHYSKVIDNVYKKMTLTARGKDELSFPFHGFWTNVQADDDDPDWWLDKINYWDLDYYKPIRVEERLIVSGTPGLGKIAYKHKFWIKKVLCSDITPSWFDKDIPCEQFFFNTYAVCYDKSKHGVYNILGVEGGIESEKFQEKNIILHSQDDDFEKTLSTLPYVIELKK